MPEEIVLRHPALPGQPLIGHVLDDGSVVPNLADAGWVIDADTPPERAKRERPEPRERPERPAPHFTAPPPPPEPPVTPEAPAGQPDNPEQGDTSLDLTKE